MGRPFFSTRPRRDDPDGASLRIYRVVGVVIIGDRKAASIDAEIRRFIVLPHARFKLVKVCRETTGLLVIAAKSFDQTISRETRYLFLSAP